MLLPRETRSCIQGGVGHKLTLNNDGGTGGKARVDAKCGQLKEPNRKDDNGEFQGNVGSGGRALKERPEDLRTHAAPHSGNWRPLHLKSNSLEECLDL